ncbi:MAG: extracellular solute-binding protein [Candidatus Kapaibacteriales bacterium]
MKKILILVFILLLTVSCRRTIDDELKFWHFWSEPNQSKVIKEIVSEFEQENNCKVQITELSWNDGKTKLIAAFNSNNPPDVLELGSDWVAQFSSSYVLELLNPKEFNLKRFYRFSLEPTYYQHKFFSIPWIIDTRVLFCNTELMEKVGLSKPPQTLEELLLYSQKINELEGFYGFGANGSDPHRLYKKIISLIWSFSGTIVDSSGNIIVNSPESRLAFDYYLRLSRAGIIETQKQIDLLFAQGKIGFCISGSWLLNMISASNANLKFITSLIPGKNLSPGISFAGGEYLAISKSSSKKELAKKFIKHLTSPKSVLKLCKNIREAGFPADSTIDINPILQNDKHKKTFAEQLRYSKMTPTHPRWLEIEPIIEEALVSVLLQKKGIHQALIDCQKKIDFYNQKINF